MKKILLTVLLLFSVMSMSTISTSSADTNSLNIVGNYENEMLAKQIEGLKKEIYISKLNSLIQYIEFNSEIIIPEQLDIKYAEFIYTIADSLKIPSRLAFRMVYKESTFTFDPTSPAGAHGIMQLMPDTRRSYYNLLRIDTLKLDKKQEDIYIGLYYVKDLYNFWLKRGNPEKICWKLALAAYNAGTGPVIKYHGIPPYKETIDFVDFILKSHSNPGFLANYMKKYGNIIKDRT